MSAEPTPTVIRPEPVRLAFRPLAPTLKLGPPPPPPRRRLLARWLRLFLVALAALQRLDWLATRGWELAKVLWDLFSIRPSRAEPDAASR